MHGIEFIQDLAVILVVAGIVGWACQRAGLSVVVGYLVAGMIVGPHTPPFSLVTDEVRVGTAAQAGLVFLMFSIGLKLSLRRLRRLGAALLLAVFVSAGIIYYLTRVAGAVAGLGPLESAFLAGMLMVSSSAIIAKILHETGANHERAGQLALGVSVLEDVVAVVMLTVLNSLVRLGAATGTAAGAAGVAKTLALFAAFVVLAGVVGLLLVPWLLRRMSIAADEELQTLGIAALLFGLAVLAQHAGYSLALGAFLLGTIVAETPHRHQVERTFAGMRDVFSAVFFVAIGMQIDLRELGAMWAIILGVTVFTLLVRSLAATTGLLLIGTAPREALRAALTVTTIGEFSFIIAQLGVEEQAVPRSFYPLAVGVSLLTTLVAPPLIRRSGRMADAVLARQPRWQEDWLGYYQAWLERVRARQKRNQLWQLSRKRLLQIGTGMMAVTGLLVFAEPLLGLVEEWLGPNWLFPHGPAAIFWTVLGLVALAPLVAIWRNCSVLALLGAQVSTQGHPQAARLAPLVETCLKLAAGAVLYVWLASFLPIRGAAKWAVVATVLLAGAALLLLRRKLVRWHSELEVELQSLLGAGEGRMSATTVPWAQSHSDWKLSVAECVLPDLADCQGKKIGELGLRSRLGCSVMGIERQGYMMQLPGPDTVLYPQDKVLLLGKAEQVAVGRKFLTAVSGVAAVSEFGDVRTELLAVPAGSQAAGRALRELGTATAQRVQVVGIKRGPHRILSPGAEEVLLPGDELLVLGTPQRIVGFKDWLGETAGADSI
ncbi:MAG: cation:proton antiporter [Verrucomicrobiota bacterium]